MTKNIYEVEDNKKEKKEAMIALLYPFILIGILAGLLFLGIISPPNLEPIHRGEIPFGLFLAAVINIFLCGIVPILILHHWGYRINEVGLKAKNILPSTVLAIIGVIIVGIIFDGIRRVFLVKCGYLDFEFVQQGANTMNTVLHLSWDKLLITNLFWLALAGFSEEILYRGFIQGRLQKVMNPMVGIALASFIFALMHYFPFELGSLFEIVPFSKFVAIFAFGFVLGYVYYKTNNIIGPIIAHGLGDGIIGALVVLGILKLFFPGIT